MSILSYPHARELVVLFYHRQTRYTRHWMFNSFVLIKPDFRQDIRLFVHHFLILFFRCQFSPITIIEGCSEYTCKNDKYTYVQTPIIQIHTSTMTLSQRIMQKIFRAGFNQSRRRIHIIIIFKPTYNNYVDGKADKKTYYPFRK